MTVEKYVTEKKEIEITGATLLSTEEAESIPLKERKYNRGWWLRSPGDDFYGTSRSCVCLDGYASYNYNPDFIDFYCFRPALILKNLEKTDFQICDIFAVRDYEFKIISNTLAWMYEDDIGCCAFRQNRRAKNPCNYEKSDVKKYVDNWFEELIK